MDQSKRERNIAKILDLFKKNTWVTIPEIEKLLHCNRQSVYNYLKKLKEQGYLLQKENRHNRIYYHIEEQENGLLEDVKSYGVLNRKVIRKYLLLEMLSEEGMTKTEIKEKVDEQESCHENILDVSPTRAVQLLEELLEKRDVYCDQSTRKYYPTAENIPIIAGFEKEQLEQLISDLEEIPKEHIYYNELNHLRKKVRESLGYVEDTGAGGESYIVYGKGTASTLDRREKLKWFSGFEYRTKILKIKYCSRKNKELFYFMAVGFMVYTPERDEIYLLGRDIKTKSRTIRMLSLKNIISVENTEEKNEHYYSKEFKRLFECMFIVSDEKPVKVEVRFDNKIHVKTKISILQKQRASTATLSEKEDVLIYRDTISGLSDFVVYLRTFGNSCTVQKPEKLKKMLEQSGQRLVERYQMVWGENK